MEPQLDLHVTRLGRRQAPLAWDIAFCCCLTCTCCRTFTD
jgi:hypothetical protein